MYTRSKKNQTGPINSSSGNSKPAVQRKSELDEATKTTVQGKVSAADRIYPGVKITIKNAVKLFDEELRYVALIEKNNEIKQGSFR